MGPRKSWSSPARRTALHTKIISSLNPRQTGGRESVYSTAPTYFENRRLRSLEAERSLRKRKVGGSIPPVGCLRTTSVQGSIEIHSKHSSRSMILNPGFDSTMKDRNLM